MQLSQKLSSLINNFLSRVAGNSVKNPWRQRCKIMQSTYASSSYPLIQNFLSRTFSDFFAVGAWSSNTSVRDVSIGMQHNRLMSCRMAAHDSQRTGSRLRPVAHKITNEGIPTAHVPFSSCLTLCNENTDLSFSLFVIPSGTSLGYVGDGVPTGQGSQKSFLQPCLQKEPKI
jgi:hypothetical protein